MKDSAIPQSKGATMEPVYRSRKQLRRLPTHCTHDPNTITTIIMVIFFTHIMPHHFLWSSSPFHHVDMGHY
jgi:hypothetical protein